MLHFESRPVPVAYQHIDALGYLYCHDCAPGEERHLLTFAVPPHGAEACARCKRVVGDVTVETTARVEIEYVTCRIF